MEELFLFHLSKNFLQKKLHMMYHIKSLEGDLLYRVFMKLGTIRSQKLSVHENIVAAQATSYKNRRILIVIVPEPHLRQASESLHVPPPSSLDITSYYFYTDADAKFCRECIFDLYL